MPLTEADATSRCSDTTFDCTQLEKIYTLDEMTTGMYMAYSKSTPQDLVDRTHAAFEQLRAEGAVRRAVEQGINRGKPAAKR